MTCKKCQSEEVVEVPHPQHGAKVTCLRCGNFIKWKGKDRPPAEYFAEMRKLGEEKKFKAGFAWCKFIEKYGRPPTQQEQMG